MLHTPKRSEETTAESCPVDFITSRATVTLARAVLVALRQKWLGVGVE